MSDAKTATEQLRYLPTKATEDLEVELSALSASITADAEKLTDNRSLFQSIGAELKRRRETKDEQPAPTIRPASREEALERENSRLTDQNRVLVLKVIEMESEQAKLVVEAEIAKAATREAQERLAMIAKVFKRDVDGVLKEG